MISVKDMPLLNLYTSVRAWKDGSEPNWRSSLRCLMTYGLKCVVFVCMGDEWRIRICTAVYGPLTYLLVDWFMVEWPVFLFSNEQVLLWPHCLKLWFIELCFKFLELVYIFGFFLINFALWIDIVEWCRHGIIQTFLANALGFLKKEEQRLLQLGLRVSTNNLVKGDCQQSL